MPSDQDDFEANIDKVGHGSTVKKFNEIWENGTELDDSDELSNISNISFRHFENETRIVKEMRGA